MRVLRFAFCLLVTMAGSTGSWAQEMGLFFDESASTCNAVLEPFGPSVRTHVFAFVEPGTELSGALFSIQLPQEIVITEGSLQWARETSGVLNEDQLTSDTGVDLQMNPCPVAEGPVLIVSFDLADFSFSGARPDLELKLGGGVILADSLKLNEPHLKICDPDDPESYLELVEVTSLTATLNCTTSCPCVPTAVTRRTWFAIKKLYMEH